jgi:hypothetical protein
MGMQHTQDMFTLIDHGHNAMVAFSDYFEGKSSAVNGCVKYNVKRKNLIDVRSTMVGDNVDCYRNLNSKNMFSIRQCSGPNKGKVTGLSPAVILENPQLIVSTAGRNRVIREGVKNVHAQVRGKFIDCFDAPARIEKIPEHIFASYAPYFSPDFFVCEPSSFANRVEFKRVLKQSDVKRFAIVSENGVIFTDFIDHINE